MLTVPQDARGGDVEEALGAASAIGDGPHPMQTAGAMSRPSLHHGSESGVRGSGRGRGGDPERCDTSGTELELGPETSHQGTPCNAFLT